MKKQEQINAFNNLILELNRLYIDIDNQNLKNKNIKARLSQIEETATYFKENVKGNNIIEWEKGKLSTITTPYNENIKQGN